MIWWSWCALAARAQEPEGITLDDAVARSTSVASIRAADAGIDAASDRLAQVRRARLPSVGVNASVNVWNGPQVVSLMPTDTPLDCSAFPAEFAGLCEGFGEPLVVRDQVTANLAAHAAVPLTGQWALGQRVHGAEAGLHAAEAARRGAAQDARYRAEEAWFLAAQADLQLEIAEAQVRSLTERVHAAASAFQLGAALRNDVLQAELALARAEQAVISVGAARDAARGRLGLAVGTVGEPLRPAGPLVHPPPDPGPPEPWIARALAQRADLASLGAQVDAARAGARAASFERLPQVAAVAQYVHTEGQGTFALPDAAWVGATLDWTVWDWGGHTAAVGAARAAADQVAAQRDGLEAAVRVEVRAQVDAVRAAIAAYGVAQRSIAQAEENLRIQDTMRQAGSGTMSDLLDAEAALVEARSRAAGTLYDAHRATAALRRAAGGEEESR